MRNDLYLKEMGGRIKAIRQSKKMTVRMLGELCGLDLSNLSRLENGQKNCYLLTLKTIAEKLEVDVKELL